MSKPINIEEFIKRSKSSHGDKYDYSKVIYKSQYEPVIIGCPIHGDFESRFGGEKEYLLQVNRDKLKNDYCDKNKIRLLRISYKDYKNLNSILVDNVLNENKILKFNDFFQK